MPDARLQSPDRAFTLENFRRVRALTEFLCKPLQSEDYLLQSQPDCSPPKWHLAHTTWFFETFILARFEADFKAFHPHFSYLFNSYYEAVGKRWPRPSRGLLSRPTVAEVYEYRHAVDERIGELIARTDEETLADLAPLLELGLNHEQQHQELLLTDLKHAFSLNPLQPIYSPTSNRASCGSSGLRWEEFPAGVRWVGHDGSGFAFDNETPRQRVFLEGFQIASRCVTVGEFLAFVGDGGYEKPEYWLADGWATRQREGWTCPLYWEVDRTQHSSFTLHGEQTLDLNEPVCHVSYYEADAYARWASARLPSEAEWETAARTRPVSGNLLDALSFHPAPDAGDGQFFGDVWEWTGSPYTPYFGYRPAPGALGEYNGKFMCNQLVLRGGSCVTPADHIRHSYRNFFPPQARWQFSGFRLAKDGSPC
jgi:ergothioneine biosynthesis protein EgtB